MEEQQWTEKWAENPMPLRNIREKSAFNHSAILIHNPTEPKDGLRGPKPAAIR